MSLIFYVYCSQELYQATEDTYRSLSELQSMFPESAFLKTQHALLLYHSKGKTTPLPAQGVVYMRDLTSYRLRGSGPNF